MVSVKDDTRVQGADAPHIDGLAAVGWCISAIRQTSGADVVGRGWLAVSERVEEIATALRHGPAVSVIRTSGARRV
jgi:hypothetical protein